MGGKWTDNMEAAYNRITVEKKLTAEDFYGGCTLCGDANEFALDIIDAAVKRAVPDIAQEDLNKTSDRLYRELHKLLSEMNND